MKTIKEWLSELHEPYRSQALKNMEMYGVNGHETATTFRTALMAAFVWQDSPEGGDFWLEISSSWIAAPSQQLFTREDMGKAFEAGSAQTVNFDAFMQQNIHLNNKPNETFGN